MFLQAVSMPQAFDNAWSAVGGGPADLAFPETFLGVWLTESTLTKVETPLGLDYVPNPQVEYLHFVLLACNLLFAARLPKVLWPNPKFEREGLSN